MNSANNKCIGWKQKIWHEMAEYGRNVIYLAIFFCVFTNYRRLILAHHQISYADYGISLIKALVLAKVIMIGEFLHLGRGLESKPLIAPTLYKACLFTVCVAILDLAECVVRGLLGASGLTGTLDALMGQFTYEWLAGILVIFFVFIPFFGLKEIERVLGKATIHNLFFRRKTESNKNDTLH